MALSIFHRVTGSGLAIVGAIVLVWWLMAAATGPAAYETFLSCAKSPLGYVVMIGLTWCFFQHLLSGLRHFVLDVGAGYELKVNKSWSMLIFFLAIAFTAILWLVIFSGTL